MAQDPTAATPPVATPESREAKLKVYDRALATVSMIALIAGGIWTAFKHFETQQKDRDQKAIDAKRDGELKAKELHARERELRFQIFKDRKETYLALCDAVSEIVAARDRTEVESKSREFLKLYVGRAHIIVDPDGDVVDKKIAFKDKLLAYINDKGQGPQISPFLYFKEAALELTTACSHHMQFRFEPAPPTTP